MSTIRGEPVLFPELKDLKTLLSSKSPCLSVYMPLSTVSREGLNPNAKQNELTWNECLQTLQDRVNRFGSAGRDLLDSVRNWDSVAPESVENGSAHARSIAVFRSPDLLEVALLDREVTARAVLGPHFYIRPLLAELVRDRSFYLLALSQKNTERRPISRSG
jgi:hypothetical protein